MTKDSEVTYRELVRERNDIRAENRATYVNKDQFETLKQKVDVHDKYLWMVISIVVTTIIGGGLLAIFRI